MMIIARLREATKAAHKHLDEHLYPVIKNIHSKDDYAYLLEVFYTFFKPVYNSIENQLGAHRLPGMENRRKPSWLLEDLEDIGMPGNNYQLCRDIPAINSTAQAWGALYVLEGSSMGGTVITRVIKEGLNQFGDTGFKFFKAYGENNAEKWQQFLSYLENDEDNGRHTDELINTGIETFNLFHAWIIQAYEKRTIKS